MSDRKRDRKNKYKNKFADSKRNEELKRGMTGFLVTCNGSEEKRCVNELFNVLNEYLDKAYPDLDYTSIIKAHQAEEASKRAKKNAPENIEAPESKETPIVKEAKGEDDLDKELNAIKRGKRTWYTFDM